MLENHCLNVENQILHEILYGSPPLVRSSSAHLKKVLNPMYLKHHVLKTSLCSSSSSCSFSSSSFSSTSLIPNPQHTLLPVYHAFITANSSPSLTRAAGEFFLFLEKFVARRWSCTSQWFATGEDECSCSC